MIIIKVWSGHSWREIKQRVSWRHNYIIWSAAFVLDGENLHLSFQIRKRKKCVCASERTLNSLYKPYIKLLFTTYAREEAIYFLIAGEPEPKPSSPVPSTYPQHMEMTVTAFFIFPTVITACGGYKRWIGDCESAFFLFVFLFFIAMQALKVEFKKDAVLLIVTIASSYLPFLYGGRKKKKLWSRLWEVRRACFCLWHEVWILSEVTTVSN